MTLSDETTISGFLSREGVMYMQTLRRPNKNAPNMRGIYDKKKSMLLERDHELALYM